MARVLRSSRPTPCCSWSVPPISPAALAWTCA